MLSGSSLAVNVEKGVLAVFVPPQKPARVAMHSFATAAGAAAAIRIALGGHWWMAVAGYLGFFVVAHLVLVPFTTAWFVIRDRCERWIRSIVEEELIRYDLRTYRDQFDRVLPDMLERQRRDSEGA